MKYFLKTKLFVVFIKIFPVDRLAMSEERRKGEIERNYSDETFYSDTSEDIQSKCKSAVTPLQKRRHGGPIGGYSNPYRNATRMMTIASSARNNANSIAQKIMSAKLLRVKQLQNELMETQFQLNELSSENRLLKTLQRRQDMALKKYEGTQAELPQLIRSHNEEVRALKTKLKQAKAQNRDLDNRLKSRDSELQALREQHRRLSKLSQDKRLGEREQLQLQLEQMQGLLKEQDKKVQMLTRKVMLEGKNFKHQLAAEISRHKTTAKELDVALDRITQLETLLETKEKFIAANMPRVHTHHTVSLVSLGPTARFRLYQSRNGLRPLQTASEPKTVNRDDAVKGRREGREDDDDIDDDDDGDYIGRNEDREICASDEGRETLAVRQTGQWRRQVLETKKEHVRIEEIEDHCDDTDDSNNDGEENYVDDCDQEESTRTSVSAESNAYLSKASTAVSMESIERETKESRKTQNSNKIKSQGSVSSFQSEMEQPLDIRERKSLRRCPVGGDSTLVPEEQSALARKGSFNGAGDNEKKGKDLGFLSSLVSEIDRDNFMRRNSLLAKRDIKAASTEALPSVKAESPEQEERHEKLPEKILPEINIEEGRQQTKRFNQSWEDLSSKLREESRKAKSMIEQCDGEVKGSITPPYNKRNLLAALKAIENGADPIDLKDDMPFPSLESQVHATTFAPLLEKPNREHEKLWETDASTVSSLPPCIVQSKEIEVPKIKADLMQELFGSQEVAAVTNFSDSSLKSRLQQQ